MAYEFYVSIEGTKQGKFAGESTRRSHIGKMVGVAFSYAVDSPRDAATGQASAKRHTNPVLFVKEWGAASPQLYQAAISSEVLKSVVFEFVTTNATGEEEVAETVTLTNATIAALKRSADTRNAFADHGHPTLDEVSFTFQKIEFEQPAAAAVPRILPQPVPMQR